MAQFAKKIKPQGGRFCSVCRKPAESGYTFTGYSTDFVCKNCKKRYFDKIGSNDTFDASSKFRVQRPRSDEYINGGLFTWDIIRGIIFNVLIGAAMCGLNLLILKISPQMHADRRSFFMPLSFIILMIYYIYSAVKAFISELRAHFFGVDSVRKTLLIVRAAVCIAMLISVFYTSYIILY